MNIFAKTAGVVLAAAALCGIGCCPPLSVQTTAPARVQMSGA